MNLLCLASYEKGHEFLREAKRQGCYVILVTSESLRNLARWPMESIDEVHYMADAQNQWNEEHLLYGVSYLARHREIHAVVPLDDFDLEKAALLREHLRLPGMGLTTTRFFRDKLAMRVEARDHGILVPDFVHVLNHDRIRTFLEEVPGPWVLKPRTLAGAIGIKKVGSAEEVWRLIDTLGDQQSHYLLERFVRGDVYHADSIVYQSEILFVCVSRYGAPPMKVSHEGGIFTSRVIDRDTPEYSAIQSVNEKVLRALRMRNGVNHTEFILSEEGQVYFLETAARAGGAHIVELVEAATGLNMWAEWAKIEVAGGKKPYNVAARRRDSAGLLVSLARQERPDTSPFSDPEVVWRMEKQHHIGLIVKAPSAARVDELLAQYCQRIERDYLASLPPQEKPTS
jgi:biotin carboxylase